MKGILRAVFLVLLTLIGVAVGGCDRQRLADAVADVATDPTSPPPAEGRHELTPSPPVTTADLERLLGVGFTVDEVVSEINRRGVLKPPDVAERAHIQQLPRGDRLLDEMESPKNLLTPAAVTLYGQRQAGVPTTWQRQAASGTSPSRVQAQTQARDVHRQLVETYQSRKRELAARLALLKQSRAQTQRRGESAISITIEIERLEREQAALVPPP